MSEGNGKDGDPVIVNVQGVIHDFRQAVARDLAAKGNQVDPFRLHSGMAVQAVELAALRELVLDLFAFIDGPENAAAAREGLRQKYYQLLCAGLTGETARLLKPKIEIVKGL